MKSHLSEFYIEKSQMPVSATLIGGEQVSGSIYLQASARGFSSLEDAPEFMNGPESFFPLRIENGSLRLLAKNHVMSMHAAGESATERAWRFGDPIEVSVVMSGGTRHTGQLVIERFAAHTRVLDFLNRISDAFIVLQREDGILLLNREHIAYVQQRDDAAA